MLPRTFGPSCIVLFRSSNSGCSRSSSSPFAYFKILPAWFKLSFFCLGGVEVVAGTVSLPLFNQRPPLFYAIKFSPFSFFHPPHRSFLRLSITLDYIFLVPARSCTVWLASSCPLSFFPHTFFGPHPSGRY